MIITSVWKVLTDCADWGHIVCTCSSLGFVISESTMIYSWGFDRSTEAKEGLVERKLCSSVLNYEWYKQRSLTGCHINIASLVCHVTWHDLPSVFAMTLDLHYLRIYDMHQQLNTFWTDFVCCKLMSYDTFTYFHHNFAMYINMTWYDPKIS